MLISELENYLNIDLSLRENINLIKILLDQKDIYDKDSLILETLIEQYKNETYFVVVISIKNIEDDICWQVRTNFYFLLDDYFINNKIRFMYNEVTDFFLSIKKTNFFKYIEKNNLLIKHIDIIKIPF